MTENHAAKPSTDFATFAAGVARLARAIEALAPLAARLGLPQPLDREWFELLDRKLLPQLQGPPLLIVAVVGGTNIGKSVVFNHLAGEMASASTPLAAGTKHPVCLASAGSDNPTLLARLFEPFTLRPWQSAEDPLDDSPTDRLYWRTGANVPPRLVLVDAPDVDSDATVNRKRAKAIGQTADVLVALLTQQKYNDAAVKQFFRAAVEADKPIIVVFNFCDLTADRDDWPQWLARFCAETGAKPELVYVVPRDRAAASELQLPFYRLGPNNDLNPTAQTPTDLRSELASLHFDAIKIRTYRGALGRVLDPRHGLPGYLDTIRAAARDFASAADAISATNRAGVTWPSLPTRVLVDEMQLWWDADRGGWSQRVHGFYRKVNRGVMGSIRAAWTSVRGPAEDPLAAFKRQEQAAVITAVEKMLDELQRLAEVGNEILRPRLQRILGGQARADLLAQVEAAHRNLPPIDDEYRAVLREELDAWKTANLPAVRFLKTLDKAMAIARPAITVTLFVGGWAVAGDLVGQAAMHVVGNAAGHLASEVVVAGGGEAMVATAGEGVGQAAARLFRQLQSRFVQQRANWLAEFLENQPLGNLLIELRQGADVPKSTEFKKVEASMEELFESTTANSVPVRFP